MLKSIGDIISQNIPAVTGLVGVCVGAWLVNLQNRSQRRFNFYEKQLREFYSPLVGIRKEIQILSEFRVAGEQAARKWWEKISEQGKRIEDHDKAQKMYDEEGQKITSQIDYENKQLTEKIIPAYRKMADIFKDNYWLAEESTRKYFPTLVKFIETWERYLSDTHPREVISEINVSEKELMLFYKDIDENLDFLRKKLKEVKNG